MKTWITLVVTLSALVFAGETAQKIEPLAQKYPGDVGIDKDPNVIFTENFEQPAPAKLKERWETVKAVEIMSFVGEVPEGSSGKQALQIAHVGGKGDGGALYRRLQPGFEHVFARFYVKIDPQCAPIHHFGTCLGGYNPPTPWPQGGAGVRPSGEKSFLTQIEPLGKNWRWDFYTYWSEMRGSPPRGQTWGNTFVHDRAMNVQRGKWTCIEVMIKLNDVDDKNGEQALWIDGEKVAHLGKGFPKGKWIFDKFMPGEGGDSVRWNDEKRDREHSNTAAGGEPFEGFRWRTVKALNVNFLWTYMYMTGAPEGHVSKVWFDDIVVAKQYIGPLAKKK